jgi:hypothetical protein
MPESSSSFARIAAKLLKRPKQGPVEVVANGRGDWIGWLELKTEPVNEIATQNTARVIREVNAHVLGTIEVDNRVALQRFNMQLVPGQNFQSYPHVMVIDGNDERGIDVGMMSLPDCYDAEPRRRPQERCPCLQPRLPGV